MTQEPTPDPPSPSIVYLDVDDEITSAAARLRSMAADRIVLVLPYGSRLSTSRINFRLLAREAAANGKRLEIVAPDAAARALAGSAGLAVHASVVALEAEDSGSAEATGSTASVASAGSGTGGPAGGASGGLVTSGAAAGAAAAGRGVGSPDATEARVIAMPRVPDPIPRVGRPRRSVGRRTIWIVAIVLVALLAGGGYAAFTLLPSATIVLTPATATIGPLQLTVVARPDVTAPDPATMTVPAATFHMDLSADQQFTTTGKQVSETKASGSVTFENCDTGGSLRVPAGSRVATASSVEFLTQSNLTVRRASVFPFGCKTGSVAVEAEQAGTDGNVPAGAISRIPPGYDSIVVSVTNTQPTTGGTHTETPIVTQQDVDGAMAQLNQALAGDFEQQIEQAAGVPAGTTLFEATKSMGAAMPSVDPSTLVGQQVAQFDLGLTATGTVLGVDPSPVTTVAQQGLASQVPAGWQLVPGSTQVDVGQPSASSGSITFPVTATATRYQVVDHDALIAQIRGLELDQARSRLQAYGQVQISLWPDWVTSIPSDTGRIGLTIVNPTPSGGPSATPSGGPPEATAGSPASSAPPSGSSGSTAPAASTASP